jgi:hypothetical protein
VVDGRSLSEPKVWKKDAMAGVSGKVERGERGERGAGVNASPIRIKKPIEQRGR